MPDFADSTTKLLASLAASPRLRTFLWRRWYEELARKHGPDKWMFMNYGFWDESVAALPLSEQDAPHRVFVGLYERVTRGVNLQGKKVVEIGSGRGGGAAYVARVRQPQLMLGLDYSLQATRLAQRLHDERNLRFRQGDAMRLPLHFASFDAVLNVESSHCYASMPQFLSEVARILKAGGTFCWCDMRLRAEWHQVRAQFEAAGLEIQKDTEITVNVLQALDLAAPAKEEIIQLLAPKFLHRPIADFAGMPGSKIYKELQSGQILYGSVLAVKK